MNSPRESPRLLLVDDEEEFLAATTRALARRGIDVRIARNGDEALHLLAAFPADVVVLDIKMPKMSGEEAFVHIRRDHPALPIILLTGHGSIPQAFSMSKGGAFDYLAKPCDIDVLARKVREAAAWAATAASSGEAVTPTVGAPGQAGEEQRVAGAALGGGPTVLLVDDDVELLDSLRNVLKRRGMRILTTQSGGAALDAFTETEIDVVILDVKLPDMDGIEVLRQMRKAGAARNVPGPEVILLSGYPDVGTAMTGRALGAIDYVVKPPDMSRLVSLIADARACRERKHEARRRRTAEAAVEHRPD